MSSQHTKTISESIKDGFGNKIGTYLALVLVGLILYFLLGGDSSNSNGTNKEKIEHDRAILEKEKG